MKTINTIMLFLFLSSAILGQRTPALLAIEEEAFNAHFLNRETPPSISIEITNLDAGEKEQIQVDYSIVAPHEPRWIKKSGKLDANGRLALELDHAFPYQQVNVRIGELYHTIAYVQTDLVIRLDANILHEKEEANRIIGAEYLGADGALNNYLKKHQLYEKDKQRSLYRAMRKLKRSKRLDNQLFLTQYDSVYALVNEIDERFIQENPSEYSWIIKNGRESNYYLLLCSRYKGKEMEPALFEKVKKHKPYLTSNKAMRFYKMMMEYLLIRTMMDHPKSSSALEKTIQFTSLLDSLFAPPKSDFLKLQIPSKNYVDQKLKLEPVINSTQTEWCKKFLLLQRDEIRRNHAIIEDVFKVSAPPTTSASLGKALMETEFGARLYQVDSTQAAALLSQLKNSFDRKALLIDFWATWCGPCLAEMPYSRSLCHDAAEMPVEFIYVCTSSGSSLEEWKSKIIEFKLSGTHLFLDKKLNDELMNLFSVSTYPSYIFINQQGEYKAGAINTLSRLDKNRLVELIDD